MIAYCQRHVNTGKERCDMARESGTGKSILAAGAAAAFCCATLYAVGQTLSFLFRDVDPDRIEKSKEKEQSAIDTENKE